MSEASDPLQEVEVLGAAPEGDVLAIVGRRRRVSLPLGERLDRAPERRSRLDEVDLVAGVCELERRREASEPAADDDDPHGKITLPSRSRFTRVPSSTSP
jgi:hypothetical protein